MSDGVAVAVGVNAGLSAAKIVREGIAAWSGVVPRAWKVQRFKRLVDNNSVLGFSDNLKRRRYASTPTFQALERCDDDGAMSIAYVPPGLGKTTAAYYFLRQHKADVRGVTICRRERSASYVTEMLSLLGLSSSSPPSGWLACLLDALQEKDSDVNRFTYLILDHFVNELADRVDSSLVEQIKSLVRNTEIRVIVLKPSESYADFLLTRNNLVGIVPLRGTYPLRQYPREQWQSMTWPSKTLKIAARHEPSLAPVAGQVEQRIDLYLGSLTAAERQQLTYVEVVRELKRALYPRTAVEQLDVAISSSLAEDENQSCHACVVC